MDAKERTLFTAVLIFSIILGIIIFYFILSIIRQQRKNLQLYRQNILAEISAMEKERARIAADLHDELAPVLSAVKLRVSSFELTEEEDIAQIKKTKELIDSIIKRMREISYDLMPSSLVRKGLLAALKEFVDYVSSGSSLNIHLNAPAQLEIPEQKAIHLYRIVQEIIHNTLKHAQATTLIIDVSLHNGILTLHTQDNGVGFDQYSQAKSEKGLGLRSILSRTEIMGGKMFTESQNKKGTNFIFEIPV